MKTPEHSRLTRSEFLRAAGGTAAGLLLAPHAAWARSASRGVWPDLLHSPSHLHPPRASVRRGPAVSSGARDGYWFITAGSNARMQTGPVILDGRGRPVWFRPMPRGWYAFNLRAQTYRGQPVLTWWEGTVFGQGEGVIMDSSYREVARVRAGGGHQVDPHEFLLTPEGTALITASPSAVTTDLSSVGGSRHGPVWESVIQEIDVATGRLVLEWRSLEHVPVSESYMWPGHGIYDYLHANSIDLTPDGNLLVSGRHTWALYKLERATGRVMWRLGGKRSHFAMAPGAQFAWQHDGRQIDEQTITVFDDGAAFFQGDHRYRSAHPQSRGLALSVDHSARRVAVGRAYPHHPPLLTGGFGNMQTLADGSVVVGWGNLPIFSHFTADGALVEELDIPVVVASYRGYRQPWRGAPAERPALTARRRRDGRGATVSVSWNGATECAAWRIRAGAEPSRLQAIATRPRTGFETAIHVGARGGYVDAIALDASGRELGRSQPVKL